MACMLLVLLALLRNTASLPSMTKHVYTSSDMKENVGSIRVQENRIFVGGSDYLLMIDRKSRNLNSIQIKNPSTFCIEQKLCVNAMVLIEPWNSTTVFACGTYNGDPTCFYVNFQKSSFVKLGRSVHADYFVTYRPTIRNPSVLFENEQGPVLYVATCNPSGRGCNIARRFQDVRFILNHERAFHRPTFLGVYHSEGKVYTFYRDSSTAFQYDGFAASGQKNEYGFVSRVCTDDQSGVNRYVGNWISFLKARLVCPYPGGKSVGSSNVYYDVLTSMFRVDDMIYGVFSLSSSLGLISSAVCSYSIREIDKYFDGSVFPNEKTLYYTPRRNKLISPYEFGIPYLPGQCYRDVWNQRQINDEYENFISETTLLGETIPPADRTTAFRSTDTLYTHVAAIAVGNHHIVCIFTAQGYMTKIRTNNKDGTNPVTLFQTQVTGLVGDIISVATVNQNILIVTKTQVVEISTVACSLHKSCEACEADPHCKWEQNDNGFVCVSDNRYRTVDVCQNTPNPPKNLMENWEYPMLSASWEGSATSYSVMIRRTRNGLVVFREIVSEMKFEVDAQAVGVKRGVSYSVSVSAVVEKTQSSAVAVEFELPLPAPMFTEVSVKNGRAFLQWKLVADAKSYNVTIFGEGRTLVSFIVTPPTRTFLTLDELPRSTKYSARIHAVSDDDTASDSEESEFVPDTRIEALPVVSIALAAFLLLSVLCVGILIYNFLNIGIRTNEIRLGKDGITLKRKCLFCWAKGSSNTGEEGLMENRQNQT